MGQYVDWKKQMTTIVSPIHLSDKNGGRAFLHVQAEKGKPNIYIGNATSS